MGMMSTMMMMMNERIKTRWKWNHSSVSSPANESVHVGCIYSVILSLLQLSYKFMFSYYSLQSNTKWSKMSKKNCIRSEYIQNKQETSKFDWICLQSHLIMIWSDDRRMMQSSIHSRCLLLLWRLNSNLLASLFGGFFHMIIVPKHESTAK